MNRRMVSLVLISSLLGWSSGLMLGLHLHGEDEDHDSHHCQTCLDLIAVKTAIADLPDSTPAYESGSCPNPPEPDLVVRIRIAHDAFGSRAPPSC